MPPTSSFAAYAFATATSQGTLDDPAFVSDLKLLADHDLSLDLVGGLEILPYAGRLAKVIPALRIVIDHLAGLEVDGKAPPADWLEQMQALVGSRGHLLQGVGPGRRHRSQRRHSAA